MNFLAFRDQIYDWTLDNDENLFSQVNQLTDYIFQTQKNIGESIAITRASLNESSTILNNNFNHYLRLSETKFTENKIAEPKSTPEQTSKKEENAPEQKSKMDIFKQALNISLKNLEIKEEEKEADNVSMSELSLSQAIFKNARLPPYFGSKEFRAQKFLNLFFDEDLGSQILSKKQIESLSNKPLSTPSQFASNITTTNVSSGYLPPPPSLDSLNLGSNGFSSNFFGGMAPSLPPPPSLTLPPPPLSLPPPPPLNILPPPPLNILPPPPLNILPSPPLSGLTLPPNIPNRQSFVQIDEKDENKQLLQSILASTKNPTNQQNARDSFSDPSLSYGFFPQIYIHFENKPLTFQQELALKLKLGKEYKPSIKVIESRPEPVPQTKRQTQPQTLQRSNSFRQSTKIDDIIGGVSGLNNNTKKNSTPENKSVFADEEQEQENALFASGKRKTTITANSNSNQVSKFALTKNEADIMMSRSTFNEDMLFKKKSAFSKESVLPTKTQQKASQKQEKKLNKASAIFDQDSDEQTDFTFKKRAPKKPEEKKPEQKVSQKKINPLVNAQTSQNKPQQPTKKSVQQTKKKTVNKLFGGDSDQEEDMFSKKKPLSKKSIESPIKNAQKVVVQIPQKTPKKEQKQVSLVKQKQSNLIPQKSKNPAKKTSLFNDDQEEDFAFKPKSKPTQKESKIESGQKKSSLFNEEEEEDFSFKTKKAVTKQSKHQQSKQPIQKRTQTANEVIVSKQEVMRKNEQQYNKSQQILQQETQSEQAAKLKKIARMGGQPIMGMAQLLSKGIQSPKISKSNKSQIPQQVILQKQQQPLIKNPTEKIKTQNIIETKTEQKLSPQKKENQSAAETISTATGELGLQVRRKKNKPKKNSEDFDQQEKNNKKSSPSILPQKIEGKILKSKTNQTKEQPLRQSSPKQIGQKQSRLQKIAKMSMAGMPQMGLGPLIPKGMLITKPSQAKKMQQQALEREKLQKQRLLKFKEQEQKQREIQQKLQQQARQSAEQQRRIQQQAQRRQKFQQEQERKRRTSEEQSKRQIQMENERQRKRLLDQFNEKQRLRTIQEQQTKRRIVEENERRKAQEKERIRAQKDAIKRAEEDQMKRTLQEQKRRAQQQATKRAEEDQIKRTLQEQKRRILQEQKRRALQEEMRRAEEEQKRRIQQERRRIQEERRRIQEQERIKAQTEQKKRVQEERRRDQEKKKSNLPTIPVFNMGGNKQTNQTLTKPKNSGPLDVPKLPPKTNPLGGSRSPLGSSLGGPLGGNTQKSSGLLSSPTLSVPTMPAINKIVTQKNAGKKSLFDEDEQDEGFSKKKPSALPKTSIPQPSQKKKGNLFDEDDDVGFGIKPKPKNTSTNKKGLFDDDDDQGFGFGKKTQKQQPSQSIRPTAIEQKNIVQVKKPAFQKATLLNNDSDDQGAIFGKKKEKTKQDLKANQPSIKIQQEIKPASFQSQSKASKPVNKKGLFGNSDSQEQIGFGKKKVEASKPTLNSKATTNNFVQNQIKPTNAAQKQIKSKKGLFGQSDEDQKSLKQSKPMPSKQVKPKKGLFGGSSDEEDDPFKKKSQQKQQTAKSPSSLMQSQKLIATKKTETPSLSPLSQPKKVESLSSSPLITSQTKLSNPLLGSSSNPMPIQPKNQALTKNIEPSIKPNPVQQKKRNIFEQSQQQSQSRTVISSVNKQKAAQQPLKKGLISQDSGEQEEQKVNVIPVKQEQPQAPIQKSNNNRRLFDGSQEDSDEEEIMKKKRMANSKLKKLF